MRDAKKDAQTRRSRVHEAVRRAEQVELEATKKEATEGADGLHVVDEQLGERSVGTPCVIQKLENQMKHILTSIVLLMYRWIPQVSNRSSILRMRDV